VERIVKKQDRLSSLSIFHPWHRVSVCPKSSRQQFKAPRDDMIVVGRTGAANVELRLATQGNRIKSSYPGASFLVLLPLSEFRQWLSALYAVTVSVGRASVVKT
jgi:hypothetical protein